jgi:hypothetical protein
MTEALKHALYWFNIRVLLLSMIFKIVHASFAIRMAKSPEGKICGYMNTDAERGFELNDIPLEADYSMRKTWNLLFYGSIVIYVIIFVSVLWFVVLALGLLHAIERVTLKTIKCDSCY